MCHMVGGQVWCWPTHMLGEPCIGTQGTNADMQIPMLKALASPVPAANQSAAPTSDLHHRIQQLPVVQLDLKLAQLQVLQKASGQPSTFQTGPCHERERRARA